MPVELKIFERVLLSRNASARILLVDTQDSRDHKGCPLQETAAGASCRWQFDAADTMMK
jgi:hypothetical protein